MGHQGLNSAERPPFPFFVGCGRSGTTLFRAMFDSHPDMAIPPETYFIVWFGIHRGRYVRDGAFNGDVFIDHLVRHRWFPLSGLDQHELRRELTNPHPSDFSDAVRRVFAKYARDRGKSRYGDKTPGYMLYMPIIGEVLPEARFVHVIRDGRDQALSVVAAPWGPSSTAVAAVHWKRRIEECRRDGQVLGTDRYREVRYEDLLDDPEGTLRQLCSFLDVSYDQAMLHFYERPGVGSDVGRPDQHSNLQRPLTKGLRDWRRDMARSEVAAIEAIAGDLLSELGYERAFTRLSPAAHLRSLRGRIGASLMRTKKRVARRRAGRRRRALLSREQVEASP